MNFIKKFYYNYIDIKLSDYKGFDSNLAINKLLFFVFLGLVFACLFINYYNGTATLLLKKLTRIGAHGESEAKKLAELGLASSRSVKWLLKARSGALKTLISIKDEKELTYEEYTSLLKKKKHLRGLSRKEKKQKIAEIDSMISPKINFDEAAFFIPTDKKDAADSFISDKSTTLTKGLISCAILFAAYIVIALVMPSILSWISGFISK